MPVVIPDGSDSLPSENYSAFVPGYFYDTRDKVLRYWKDQQPTD